jgi:hypothetical protein
MPRDGLAYLHKDEVILNRSQQLAIGHDALTNAGIPGIAGTGGNGQQIVIQPQFELKIGTQTIDEMIVKGMSSHNTTKSVAEKLSNISRYR